MRLCGQHDPGLTVVSTGRQLLVEFITDCSIEAKGYVADYEFIFENDIGKYEGKRI